MIRRAQFAALLAVVLVIAAAGMASGTDGQPIIAGVPNTESGYTFLTNTSLSGGALVVQSQADEPTLRVLQVGDHGDGGALDVFARSGVGLTVQALDPSAGAFGVAGRSAFGDGPVMFDSTSGLTVVPAGSSKLRVQLPAPTEGPAPMDDTSHIVATLQQFRNAWVVAVTPHPATQSFTIFLSRAVFRDTRVAWFMFDSLH